MQWTAIAGIWKQKRDKSYPMLQAAPGALKKTKQLIDQLCSRSLLDDIEMCMLLHMQARKEAEAQEGIRAFLEKRKPVWEKSWKLSL
jgi:enoyl-CoA hydratase/carnithine racemase